MTWNTVFQIAALAAIGVVSFVIVLAAVAAVRDKSKGDKSE